MISRRKFLTIASFGAILGITGMAFTRTEASIRFIGRRETIVALLDTGVERVLFLLGESDDELLGDIAGLSIIGNTRIDMVVGSYGAISTRSAREHLRLDATTAIVIQSDTSLPPIRGDISTVTATTDLQLGDSTRIRIAPSPGPAENQDFVVDIHHKDTRVILVSNEAALRLVDAGSCAVLVVPGRPGETAINRVQPQLIVCNSPNLEQLPVSQMQVYRTDPQVVRIEGSGIRVHDDQLSS